MTGEQNAGDIYVTPSKNSVLSSEYNDIYPICNEEYKPCQGMIFESLQEGIAFYKTYAQHAGFNMRLSSENKKNGIIYYKYCVCSSQGWHNLKEPDLVDLEIPIAITSNDESNVARELGEKKVKVKRRRSLTRVGCTACCTFKRNEDGKYEILKVLEGHTHPLATPSKKRMLKSARDVNSTHKHVLRACHRNSIGTSQAFNLMKEQVGGLDNVGCLKRDFQNYHRNLKVMIDGSDGHMFIETLKRCKSKNPSFYYAYEVDDEFRLKHVFWADGISRKNYYIFGDAISFDTTYDTNKYSMIFAPFTGVNHHRQSITFGAAFLANEKAESFIWLFQKFLEAMGDKKPTYIVTDQDPAMRNAIELVFNTSIHRFCVWHIMRKVSEKVGGVLNANIQFHSTLKACVWGSETELEFELTWKSIMVNYGLEKNDWFSLMYSLRHMWIPAFFIDILLSGLLRTTSRSESANSMFSKFVNNQLALVEFWIRFDCAIESQRDNENEADHINLSSFPQLRTGVDLEKHGMQLYTRNNFYIFQDELRFSCIDCVVADIHYDDDVIRTYTILDGGKKCYKSKREVIYYTSNSEAKCSCKMFELEGIPCRHILVALRGDMKREIPNTLILNRWTKFATRKPVFDDSGILLERCVKEKNKTQLVTDAWGCFFEVMHRAESEEEDLKMVIKECNSMKKKLSVSGEKVSSKSNDLESFVGCSVPKKIEILPPKPCATKGGGKRIKGGKEIAIEQQEKQRRHCKSCGQYAHHDSRNCPTKDNNHLG